MATPGQIAEVAKHYIIACIWADAPGCTRPRATHQSNRIAFERCKSFIDKHHDLFNAAMECAEHGYGSHPDAGSAEGSFGHDLYLSTTGHGVGFRDRLELSNPWSDHSTLGEELQKACEDFGEPYPEFYRGWLYFNP